MIVAATNYPAPVQVNGFACRNCGEVSLATKGIDPAHPQSGPAGRNAANDPTRSESDPVKADAMRRLADSGTPTPQGYTVRGLTGGAVPTGQLISLRA